MYQKQIRKEFYNDIDDCLEKYVTVTNGNDKQKKIITTIASVNSVTPRKTISTRKRIPLTTSLSVDDDTFDDNEHVQTDDNQNENKATEETILQIYNVISENNSRSSIKLTTSTDILRDEDNVDGGDHNYELDEIIIKFSTILPIDDKLNVDNEMNSRGRYL